MSKIYYFCYFSNYEKDRRRDAVPAADLQVGYLAEVFEQLGYEVEIVGLNIPEETDSLFRFQRAFCRELRKNIIVRYFNCIESKNRNIRRLARRLIFFSAKKYIDSLTKEDIILFYHSRLFYPYYKYMKKCGRRYILELEEIYSDVIDDDSLRKEEIAEVKRADSFILPSVPLADEIAEGKNYVLFHGSCRREKRIGNGFHDGRIHIVYAGTFDYRVIGSMSMIYAAKYLDERYHIHIIGFGNDEDTNRIVNAVDEMKGLPCKVSYDGLQLGDNYLRYLQNCDIGIFSRDPKAKDINSSFPSKIMSYLSNGLRVVSTRAESIEKSDVAHLMYFVDSNSPEEVARTIKGIDFSSKYDGYYELEKVENKLKNRLKNFLIQYKEVR